MTRLTPLLFLMTSTACGESPLRCGEGTAREGDTCVALADGSIPGDGSVPGDADDVDLREGREPLADTAIVLPSVHGELLAVGDAHVAVATGDECDFSYVNEFECTYTWHDDAGAPVAQLPNASPVYVDDFATPDGSVLGLSWARRDRDDCDAFVPKYEGTVGFVRAEDGAVQWSTTTVFSTSSGRGFTTHGGWGSVSSDGPTECSRNSHRVSMTTGEVIGGMWPIELADGRLLMQEIIDDNTHWSVRSGDSVRPIGSVPLGVNLEDAGGDLLHLVDEHPERDASVTSFDLTTSERFVSPLGYETGIGRWSISARRGRRTDMPVEVLFTDIRGEWGTRRVEARSWSLGWGESSVYLEDGEEAGRLDLETGEYETLVVGRGRVSGLLTGGALFVTRDDVLHALDEDGARQLASNVRHVYGAGLVEDRHHRRGVDAAEPRGGFVFVVTDDDRLYAYNAAVDRLALLSDAVAFSTRSATGVRATVPVGCKMPHHPRVAGDATSRNRYVFSEALDDDTLAVFVGDVALTSPPSRVTTIRADLCRSPSVNASGTRVAWIEDEAPRGLEPFGTGPLRLATF
ncbi:MAG: hypothetical protein RLP09_24685 [Sandaracinaceae bacterium]